MGKIGRKRRHMAIKQKNERRRKLHHMKELYASAKKTDRDKIEAKARRIAPYLATETYLKDKEVGQ